MADELKSCKYCGTLGATGCDDISLPPGVSGRSNLCFKREITNLRAEVAALKARLAKFEGPLTDEQRKVLFDSTEFCAAWDNDDLPYIDAAIRAAREGE